jgi:ubiquinone/menaquinone biosynthesis C-methylase UbiE
MSVIEIGAGSGWQANLLKRVGIKVIPLDIIFQQSDEKFIQYDGVHLPIQSSSVDLIYSSNTLEHVNRLDLLQNELHRVLKPSGRALHILPTPTWRFWTSVEFYLLKLRRLKRWHSLPYQTIYPVKSAKSIASRLFPERHGIAGNFLTEHQYFSRTRWSKHFIAAGWKIERIDSNRLYYAGYSLLDARLSIKARHYLSYLVGSSCAIYVLRKAT